MFANSVWFFTLLTLIFNFMRYATRTPVVSHVPFSIQRITAKGVLYHVYCPFRRSELTSGTNHC